LPPEKKNIMDRNIGILGAMAQEIDEVKTLLTEKTIVKIANREFVVGKIGTVRCVVAFSKWGKVAASITATLMIQEFAVTDLFFIGTAGALAEGLKVGDVVISKRLVQHDLDARPIISRFELPLLNRVYIDSDPDLTDLAGRAVSRLINKGVENMVGQEVAKAFDLHPTLHFGDIASGDQFINSDEKRMEILGLLPNVLCVEMEGAAVAQTCLEFGTPFTVIRTISDTADHNARIDFGKFIIEVADAYSRAIVTEIMNEI
jgi:adenosylhomocysteine nucleosidase